CYEEWRLIRMHDADHENQFEAKKNLRTLKRIAKAIEQEKESAESHKRRSFLAGTTGLFGKFFQ
ncbi:MAG: hypothetical protein K8F91_03260, partial [Candidatus Obscuribacterales bacterium]|nr:hypothetical protein [Candidatus Obscuribacterales bacterium]